MQIEVNNSILELIQGDITELENDAIVNAANSQLVLGGGVAGAIRRKGGPEIQVECNRKAPIQVGQAVITTAANLPARYVIHAVGPRMGEGDEDRKLENATLSSLKVADENNLRSLAFCAISTGIFGFPMERCAEIMLKTTLEHLNGSTGLERVVFCLYDGQALEVFQRRLEKELSQ